MDGASEIGAEAGPIAEAIADVPEPEAGAGARRRVRRRLWMGAGGLALIAALALVLTIAWLRLDGWSRVPFGVAGTHSFEIAPGTRTGEIAQRLARAGLVSGEWELQAWLRATGRAHALEAGHYEITAPLSPAQLAAALSHGAFERSLTIPEGWTAQQIARRLNAEKFIGGDPAWVNLVAQPLPESALGVAMPQGAEGFCFPDTYRFESGVAPEAILARMLGTFRREWSAARPDERDPRAAALTMREVVTLAAMIEREARAQEEMPAIASVYLNRLQQKMRLQCCATVRYALGGVWDRDLSFADLKIDSPYNTYVHAGLPPGPICNPGRAAIEAVLRPAHEDYLFYVYNGEGRHIFSRTYAEHLKAIAATHAQHPAAVIGAQGRE